ncbi:MAG: hypothetical protein U5J98_07520 [Halobacteriales archaeon]|nr:hypothetical protein [Halobacteriales archaeon]
MEPTPDELAGVVDGFGGLTRRELRTALADLAARAGEGEAVDLGDLVDEAIESYYLLELDPDEALADPEAAPDDEPLLIPGPAALPELPDGGEDLPHLLAIEPRSVDREAAAGAAESALRADAAAAIDDGDTERAALLLDACYEVEAWGPVDLGDAKAGLAALLE